MLLSNFSTALMSQTYPIQASALRIGGYVVIRGHPCKIIKMTTHKTGKHGHAKVHFTGLNIFTGSKQEMLESSTHNVEVPHVYRNEFQLIDITDDHYLTLMSETGEMKEDLDLPTEEIGEQILSAHKDNKELMIIVQAAMGQEQAISFKESKDYTPFH